MIDDNCNSTFICNSNVWILNSSSVPSPKKHFHGACFEITIYFLCLHPRGFNENAIEPTEHKDKKK